MGKRVSKQFIYADILMLGLSGAGKTTLLYQKQIGRQITTVPTLTYNCETLQQIEGVVFRVRDLSGMKSKLGEWSYHYTGIEGLIFVIDCSDKDKFEDVKLEFNSIVNNDALQGVPLVVFAHKQDLPDSYSSEDIEDMLETSGINDRPTFVFGTSSITGSGVDEGLLQLSKCVRMYILNLIRDLNAKPIRSHSKNNLN